MCFIVLCGETRKTVLKDAYTVFIHWYLPNMCVCLLCWLEFFLHVKHGETEHLDVKDSCDCREASYDEAGN